MYRGTHVETAMSIAIRMLLVDIVLPHVFKLTHEHEERDVCRRLPDPEFLLSECSEPRARSLGPGRHVCVDIRADVCRHVCRHLCRQACSHVSSHVRRHVFMHVCRHACKHVRVGMCIDMCVGICLTVGYI